MPLLVVALASMGMFLVCFGKYGRANCDDECVDDPFVGSGMFS